MWPSAQYVSKTTRLEYWMVVGTYGILPSTDIRDPRELGVDGGWYWVGEWGMLTSQVDRWWGVEWRGSLENIMPVLD